MRGDFSNGMPRRHATSAPADSTRTKEESGSASSVQVEVFLLVTLLIVDVRVVMGLMVECVRSVVKVNFQMISIFVKIALMGTMWVWLGSRNVSFVGLVNMRK
jgi:hypothetical protein